MRPLELSSAASARTDAYAAEGAVVTRFDAVLHAVNPHAPPIDAARLAALTCWLTGLDATQSRRELQQRLARLRELRRMDADADWEMEPSRRASLRKLLAFVEAPHDGSDAAHAHQDRAPHLGRLDDALMVELAWPAFADEVEDYLDFCRFRREQHPRGAPPLTRSDWFRMHDGEGTVWQQLGQVRVAPNAELGPYARA